VGFCFCRRDAGGACGEPSGVRDDSCARACSRCARRRHGSGGWLARCRPPSARGARDHGSCRPCAGTSRDGGRRRQRRVAAHEAAPRRRPARAPGRRRSRRRVRPRSSLVAMPDTGRVAKLALSYQPTGTKSSSARPGPNTRWRARDRDGQRSTRAPCKVLVFSPARLLLPVRMIAFRVRGAEALDRASSRVAPGNARRSRGRISRASEPDARLGCRALAGAPPMGHLCRMARSDEAGACSLVLLGVLLVAHASAAAPTSGRSKARAPGPAAAIAARPNAVALPASAAPFGAAPPAAGSAASDASGPASAITPVRATAGVTPSSCIPVYAVDASGIRRLPDRCPDAASRGAAATEPAAASEPPAASVSRTFPARVRSVVRRRR